LIVSDATPLIALARIGAFSLLEQLFTELRIPPAVYDDVVTRGTSVLQPCQGPRTPLADQHRRAAVHDVQ